MTNTILIAGDEDNDLILIQRAIQTCGLANPVRVVRDGEEAIEYLAGQGRYADRAAYPMPFLLLLTLQIPKQSCFYALRWIGEHPELHNLKAVVLTSSWDEQDSRKAIELGAHSFFVKPGDSKVLASLISEIQKHWPEVHGTPTASTHLAAAQSGHGYFLKSGT